jgi:uncharacterized protein involved in cysteine biosynthesis
MRKYIILIIVALIVLAGGLFWLGMQAERGIPDEQDIRISIDNPFQ